MLSLEVIHALRQYLLPIDIYHYRQVLYQLRASHYTLPINFYKDYDLCLIDYATVLESAAMYDDCALFDDALSYDCSNSLIDISIIFKADAVKLFERASDVTSAMEYKWGENYLLCAVKHRSERILLWLIPKLSKSRLRGLFVLMVKHKLYNVILQYSPEHLSEHKWYPFGLINKIVKYDDERRLNDYLFIGGATPDAGLCAAIYYGKVDYAKMFIERGAEWPKKPFDASIGRDHIEMMEYLKANEAAPFDTYKLCKLAVASKNPFMLGKVLGDFNLTLPQRVKLAAIAAIQKNFTINAPLLFIKPYAEMEKVRVDKRIRDFATIAVTENNIECVEWLIANNYPIRDDICTKAVKSSKLIMLKKLHAAGFSPTMKESWLKSSDICSRCIVYAATHARQEGMPSHMFFVGHMMQTYSCSDHGENEACSLSTGGYNGEVHSRRYAVIFCAR